MKQMLRLKGQRAVSLAAVAAAAKAGCVMIGGCAAVRRAAEALRHAL